MQRPCVVLLAGEGPATRIVSYIDPAVISALHAHAGSMAANPSGMYAAAMNIARLQLVCAGFLRAQPGITLPPPVARNTSTTGGSSPDLIIYQ